MARYKLTFEYDGTHFSGWQKQPDVRTVEGEVEKAFSILYQQDVDLIGQGRTDAGVHARGQVAHADLPDRYPPLRIIHAMKGLLPEDVALLSAEIVADDFHARFDATSRMYSFTVATRPSPLRRHTAWQIHKKPDSKLLQTFAKKIEGEHDFINFCIPQDDEFGTTICTISQSNWEINGDERIYRIEGSRFLRHMVRRLVGSMVQVATGELGEEEFDALLSGKQTVQKAHTAPSHGLVLELVNYL
ncbi:MAG: tRNA pseudouridine(38-40) synthase TruA [Balneolaceae bacterium]|nr:tRNA pseudouridine(38-40) synthase TruA [Balneolaceae bacterium]